MADKKGASRPAQAKDAVSAPENHGVWRAEGVVSLRKKSKKSSKPVKLQIFSNAVLIHKVSKSSNSSSKKKKVAASEAIPLHLCWLNPNPELSEWQLVDSNAAKSAQGKQPEEPTTFYFTLIGPEESYLIGVKSERERQDWTVVIVDCLTQFRANPQNPDIRKGKYQFSHYGSYDGEWLRGKVHGRGTFVNHDGTTFTGDWNSQLGAGFGEIKAQNANDPHEGGWEFVLPGGNVKEVKSDVFSRDEGLTERDVKLLLQGATVKTFKKGDVIKNEGDVNESLYRIKSGTISLQKIIDGQRKTLAEMTTEQMFGEMSILDKNIISATVVAESAQVELECIELTYLYGLFRSEPGLSKRFHKMMARTLAQRLSKLMPKRDENNKPSGDAQGESKRPAVRATFSGLLMSGGGSSKSTREDSAELKFARSFLKAWTADSKLTNFFTENVVYRDPFVPQGISGRSALLKYRVSQRQTVKRWDWDDVELFPVPDGFTMRAKVHLTLSSGASATDYSLSLIVLEEGKIRRMEVYFDKAALKKADDPTPSAASSSSTSATTDDEDEDSGSGSSNNSNPLEAPVKRRAKDIKFSKRFDLPDEEIILREFPCVYASVDCNGKLYISSNYVCFYSRVFGLRTKEAIPFKSIKQVRKKGTDSVVLRMHRKTKSIIGGSEVKHQFIFPSQYDVDEAYATLSQRLHRLDGDDINALIVTDNDREGHVQNESYIQKFVRCSTLHVHLPEMKLKFLAVDKAVRLIAPKLNESAWALEDDSCVRTISTYPHLSTMLADGTAQVDKNVRQGDPICDQACLERFENGVLIALADGCNWGEKPRKAAYLASRTFIEYVKRSASEVLTVQDAGQLFLQAFVQAHHRIVEGYEDKWWECGTTTLIGGALVQLKDPYNPWGFVCASVGDCKAFLITRRKGVFDITSGSRTGAAATDATDSGGRIGPHVEGNPDLRNLSLYFRLVDEGDVIVVVSDGLYDNLDPQSLGISPKDAGIADAGSDWTKVPAETVEKVKSDYMCEKIRSLLWGEPVRVSRSGKDDDEFSGGEGSDDVYVDLDPTAVVETLVKHAKETTQSSRDFMEKFPNLKLPTDYGKYPGKMDHTTACAFKVKATSFRSVEGNLDNLVIRMRHPVKGLHSVMQKMLTPESGKDPLQLAVQGQGATGVLAQVGSSRAAADSNKPASTSSAPPIGALKRSHETQSSTSSLLADFRGQLLTRWLEDNETKDPEEIAHLAQCLINFRYIRPLDLESWKTESFAGDQVYQFRMYEPILTRRDWEAVLLGSQIVTFKKDEAVVVEQVTQHQRLYYIVSGTCRIEKAVDASSAEHKSSKRSGLISSKTGKLLLGHMYESETFGEISFLFGGRASASVIADSDEVKLYIIEGRFLNVLFVKYPSLAGRFFHYLSSVLAHRLKKQEAKKYAEAI